MASLRSKRNIRAAGGKTVHSGDLNIPCGFRDKIAPNSREIVDLPVNCKVELGYDRQTVGDPMPVNRSTPSLDQAPEPAPEPDEHEDQVHTAELHEHEHEDQDHGTDLAIVRPSPIVGIGKAIVDLGSLVENIEHNTPSAFGKAVEQVGLDLLRLGMRCQDIA